MSLSDYLDENGRAATDRHRDRLETLGQHARELLPLPAPTLTFVCNTQALVSAEAFPCHRVVAMAESLLDNAPERVIETVALHEGVHLLVGRAWRDSVAAESHVPAYELLHRRIIPDWLAGKIPFEVDANYLLLKGWRQLYDRGWLGPMDVEQESAARAAGAYFAALQRGHVFIMEGNLMTLPPSATEAMPCRWCAPLADEYESAAATVGKMIATGFELMEYFHSCFSAVVGARDCIDVATVEEGVANFVSTAVTGVSLEEVQRWAPQDPSKIQVARDLQRSGIGVEDVLRSTVTLEDMVECVRGSGAIR